MTRTGKLNIDMETGRTEDHSDSAPIEQPGVESEHIPNEILSYSQWVCWRYVDRGKERKPDKQPVNPRTLANAGVHWANTWTTFEEAYATYLRHRIRSVHGVGFVLTASDPYVAVDIDACLDERGIEGAVMQMIGDLGSYTEISPSGHGVRILLACPEFQGNARRGAIEVYSHSRYVTITGHHVAGTPLGISPVSHDVVAGLIPPTARLTPSQDHHEFKPTPYATGAMELWERIFTHDRYGTQHLKRFKGDMSLDGGDHSFTVIRLVNCLARWTHSDPAQMRSMMLVSPLANDKWFEQRGEGDWLDHQIADAIAYVGGGQRK